MVILETAAIGAAGYGLYRGGDAAVRKTKETTKELQRERVRQAQRSDLNSKVKTRQERIKELVNLRQGGKGAGGSSSNSSSSSSLFGSSSSDRAISTTTTTAASSSSSSSIDDRHRNVMERLRQGRSEERASANKSKKNKGGLMAGLFSSSGNERK